MTTSSLPRRGMRLLAGERDYGDAQPVAAGRMGDKRETEPGGSRACEGDDVGIGSLREQHDAAVPPEVRVAQLRMPVEPESAPNQCIEMLREEVGEIEGAELFIVQGLEL